METKSLSIFRDDLRQAIRDSGMTQYQVQLATGVSQGVISNFLRASRGLSVRSFEKLWRFVYGTDLAERRFEQ